MLQFYGSNETGVLSGTRLTDSRERRFGTAGRVIQAMAVGLLRRRSTSRCRGPPVGSRLQGPGHVPRLLATIDANAQLMTERRMDAHRGRGRARCRRLPADRREAVRHHHPGREEHQRGPASRRRSAAARRGHGRGRGHAGPTFGERVCLFDVSTRDGSLTLDAVTAFLARAAGVGKEQCPERLVLARRTPPLVRGKVAKGELRADIRTRLAAE